MLSIITYTLQALAWRLKVRAWRASAGRWAKTFTEATMSHYLPYRHPPWQQPTRQIRSHRSAAN